MYHHVVRYFECDQQGVVFNMWYLGYFDEAFAAFLAAGGLPYPELIASGVDVQLVHSEVDWSGPLRWGDEAEVAVSLGHLGRTSFSLLFAVTAAAGAEPVARGRTVYVTVATDGAGKVPVPERLVAAVTAGAAEGGSRGG